MRSWDVRIVHLNVFHEHKISMFNSKPLRKHLLAILYSYFMPVWWIVKTMPWRAVDSSMHYCLRPQGRAVRGTEVHWAVHGTWGAVDSSMHYCLRPQGRCSALRCPRYRRAWFLLFSQTGMKLLFYYPTEPEKNNNNDLLAITSLIGARHRQALRHSRNVWRHWPWYSQNYTTLISHYVYMGDVTSML